MKNQNQYTRENNKAIENKHFAELNPLVAGWQNCKPSHFWGPSVREFYLIHYVVSGKGTFENEKGVYELSSGQYFIIRPKEKFRYEADSDMPWEYVWIGFNGALASRFDTIPDTGNFSDAQLFLDIKYVNDKKTKIEEFLASKLFMLYHVFFCQEETSDLPAQICNFINNNYTDNLRVEDIAEDFGISRVYLTKVFKERYGMTVKDYILHLKMDHAKILLTGGLSVAETALLVGYSDQFVFSKMFKKICGKSPSCFITKKDN